MKTLRIDRRLSRWMNVTLGGRLRAVTLDVSEFGFCAELEPVFLPGSQIEGKIQLRERTFPFRGTVAWAEPGSRLEQKRSRIGVRFEEIGAEFARLLYGAAPLAG